MSLIPSPRRRAALAATLPFLVAALCGQSPAPGLRLFGPLASTDTWLVDTAGAIVHTWSSTFPAGTGVYVLADGTLLRAAQVGASIPPGAGGGVQRFAFDGTLLWDYRYDGPGVLSHHDIAPLPNGNVLLTAWEDKTIAEAIAAGRDPALLQGAVFRPDHLVEVQPTGPTTGAIVWEWHVWDHLVQDFDALAANYGDVHAHPELVDINYPPDPADSPDWNHGNGIDYDPVYDRIFYSTRPASEVWVIDHGTTTAEASSHQGGRWGRGGDLLYRFGNPAAYRSALPRQLDRQHAPTVIPPGRPGAGHVLVFDNFYTPQNSAVLEFDLPLDPTGAFVPLPGGEPQPPAVVWTYTSPTLFSNVMSNGERLPNGNTLISSSRQNTVFEVDANGAVVWSYVAPPGFLFHAHYVERTLWPSADVVGAANLGAVDLHLRLGSAFGGDMQLLLASAAGTAPGLPLPGGGVFPLNPDGWLGLSLIYRNAPGLLDGTFGVLAGDGSADARFHIVPGILPLGLQLHFAALVTDAQSGLPVGASNPVPVRIGW